MNAKTTWLLDVDGVINASRAGWSRAPVPVTVRAHDGHDYKLKVEPEVLRAIRRLIDAGVVVTWCSTWCQSARALETELGLPEMPVAFDEDYTGQDVLWAKRAAAVDALRAGRLVWTDDQITDTDVNNLETWVATNATTSVTHGIVWRLPLIIAPKASRGLRPEDIERIERFCLY